MENLVGEQRMETMGLGEPMLDKKKVQVDKAATMVKKVEAIVDKLEAQ